MIVNRIKQLIYILLLFLTIYVFYLASPFITSVLSFIISVLVPFVISFSLAFILYPVVLKFDKLFKKRIISILVVYAIIILFIYLLFNYTIPRLGKELTSLSNNIPDIIAQIEQLLDNLRQKLQFIPADIIPTTEDLTNLSATFFKNIAQAINNIISSIFEYLSIVALIPISLIYFLMDYEKLIDGLRQYLIRHNKMRLKACLGEIERTMMSYFKGYLLVILILTISSTIIFMLFGIEFSLVFGLILAVADIIPFIGSYIGGAFPVIYAFLTSPTKGLYVLIAIVILQLIESNLITPYIQSKQTKNHPLLVLSSMIIFGRIFGIIGMIIAVPVLSIIRITFKYYGFMFSKAKPKQI